MRGELVKRRKEIKRLIKNKEKKKIIMLPQLSYGADKPNKGHSPHIQIKK